MSLTDQALDRNPSRSEDSASYSQTTVQEHPDQAVAESAAQPLEPQAPTEARREAGAQINPRKPTENNNEKGSITGRVMDRVKGGVSVDLGGAVAFLPGSQVDIRPAHNLDALKGQPIEVRVIKLNKKRGNVVVSRKAILDEQVAEQRGKT